MDFKTLFPNGSKHFFDLNTNVSPTKLKPNKEKSLGKAVQREKESMGRIILSYTGFFVRPQDPDNFAASTKDCTDGLRRCGLIDGDEPWKIKLITEQERVKTFAEERLEVTITYPDAHTPNS